MIPVRSPRRAAAMLAAVCACGFVLSGCSVSNLASDDLLGGQDSARIRLTAASGRVAAEGGEITVDVSNAGRGEMNWSASLNANWARISGESEGAGNATLTLAFESNTSTEERTVTLSIRSGEASNSPQTVTITQAAAQPEPEPAPSLSASAEDYGIGAEGGRLVVTLKNEGGGELDWSASLPDSIAWARFVGKSAGIGEGTVQIEVDANPAAEARSFELTVTAEGASASPQSLHFSQEPADAEAKGMLEVSAGSYELSSEGGSVDVTVTAGADVEWEAALGDNADWAHFTGASSGTGNGRITIRYDRNDEDAIRSLELTVTAEGANASPQSLHFTQEFAEPETGDPLVVSAAGYELSSEGGSVDVTVTAGAGVQWEAALGGSAAWAHFSGASSGSGNGRITIRFGRNPEEQERAFELTVTAAGASASPQSLHFSQAPADPEAKDMLEVSAGSYELSSEGGSVEVTVTAGAGVEWEAAIGRNATWAHFTGASSGTGDGRITIRFGRNPQEQERAFELTVTAAGANASPQSLHFSQAPADPEAEAMLEVSAGSYELSFEGGSVDVTVTAGAGVEWEAALGDNADWAHFSGASSGTGDGRITIRFGRNPTEQERAFELTVTAEGASASPQSLHFSQAPADPEAEAMLEVSAGSYELSSEGGSVEVTVTAGAGVEWEAAVGDNATWAHFSGASSGTGNGRVTIRYDRNDEDAIRSLELTVTAEAANASPQSLHFTQEFAEPETRDPLEISAQSYELSSEGGSVEVTVTAGADVHWEAALGGSAAWAHFSGASSGTGNGRITIGYDRNDEEAIRSFELTVTAEGAHASPQSLHFTQEFAEPETGELLGISALSYELLPNGGSVEVTVTVGADVAWEAAIGRNATWAHFSGASSGTGNGSITIRYDPNDEEAIRSFELSVTAAGASASPQSLHFSQSPAETETEDLLGISAPSYELAPEGGSVEVTVTAGADVDWEAAIGRNATWAHFSGASSGTGDGSITIRYDPNDEDRIRSFELTVTAEAANASPQSRHFTQGPAMSAQIALWTETRRIGAGGGRVEARVSVSPNADVVWIAEVDVDWTQLAGAADGMVDRTQFGGAIDDQLDGTGDAVLRLEVDPNPGAERTFTLAVRSSTAIEPQPVVFHQAAGELQDEGVPVPPQPPAWYFNECQRQTPGFEALGGWLAQRGYYQNPPDSRVWRHAGDDKDLSAAAWRAFSDCADDRRTVTVDILADDSILDPVEFGDLPVADDARIVLLDISAPVVGNHAAGARHENPDYVWATAGSGWYPTYTQDGEGTKFLHVQPLGDWGYESASGWDAQLTVWEAGGSDMSAWTGTARQYGWRLPSIQERTGEGRRMLANADTSLWLLVGGYTGSGGARSIHPGSAVCGEASELCLFAPWAYQYEDADGLTQTVEGTAVAAAQVAAALDNVLLLWPDYGLLELRDLVLDCAEDMGDEGPDAMWGRGVLSFNCLFTPHSDLRDPRTGTILSGGIYGPLAGPYGGALDAPSLLGPAFGGVDRTGRNFAYPLARWSHRENHALLAATAVSAGANPTPLGEPGGHPLRSRSETIFEGRNFSTRIAAAGDALGAAALWRPGGMLAKAGLLTIRGGLALQPEGAGSLTGSGVFRAPSTLSGAFSVAFQHSLTSSLLLNAHANYWMTLNTGSRSLWNDAHLSEFRASASLSYRVGRAQAVLQAQYAGGLHGRLDVAEQSIHLIRRAAKQLSLRIRVPLGTQPERTR